MGGDARHGRRGGLSGRGRLRLALSVQQRRRWHGGACGGGSNAGHISNGLCAWQWQADLPPRQQGALLGEGRRRRHGVLVAQWLLVVQQVADLHDVADDLDGARRRLLPLRGEVLLHLFEVGGRGPAFLILVPCGGRETD